MKSIVVFSCLLFLSLSLFSQKEKGFQFIESSSGMNYPSWESGKTELEFADINMDGFVDILSIGDHGCPLINAQEHGIMVWFGDGTGSWSVQMVGDFGYGGIAIGDVNNDGHWDIGYGMHHNYSATDLGDQLLEVALGDGSGTNWTAWDDGLATNGEDWGLFGTDFADVDNDGDLDVGTNSFGSGSGLHVYINQGDGSWIQSFGILPGNSNMRFVFGDINKDGNADFVVTHDAGIVFFGDGTGNFYNADYNLPPYSFPVGGPDLKDINKDGSLDLAYVVNGGIKVWAFDVAGNEWIDFSGSLPVTGNYQEVQLCDFNMDGTMDLAGFGNATLTVWRGTLLGDGIITWTQEFSTITSNNGYCAAFRAGGDVDRNGYPDMTLVEKEGSWPNDMNHLKCFKETSPIIAANIKAVFPLGKEVFKQGSVQFIDWISAIPPISTSQVKISYSLTGNIGPWTTLTNATANSGRYQWIIPQTISSNNCYIRCSLVEGIDTMVSHTPMAFTILGEDGLEADFTADSTYVHINSPIQFTDQSLGLLTSWEWDFDNNGVVDDTVRNPIYAYSQAGEYTVKLSVSDGTNNETEIKENYITVISSIGIEEDANNNLSIEVYPNPCSGFTHLKYQVNAVCITKIDLFTVSGKMVRSLVNEEKIPGEYEIDVDVSDLPAGIYILEVRLEDVVVREKIIIQ